MQHKFLAQKKKAIGMLAILHEAGVFNFNIMDFLLDCHFRMKAQILLRMERLILTSSLL